MMKTKFSDTEEERVEEKLWVVGGKYDQIWEEEGGWSG